MRRSHKRNTFYVMLIYFDKLRNGWLYRESLRFPGCMQRIATDVHAKISFVKSLSKLSVCVCARAGARLTQPQYKLPKYKWKCLPLTGGIRRATMFSCTTKAHREWLFQNCTSSSKWNRKTGGILPSVFGCTLQILGWKAIADTTVR